MSKSPFRLVGCLPQWRNVLGDGVSDSDLLTRFASYADKVAFELLMRRHGPMVLATCRRMLGNHHDAEDAFQAAFLILARKATRIVRRGAVASWLYQVACRVASRVRADRARQAQLETLTFERMAETEKVEPDLAELWQVLDEEIERLPARHRSAFVLCCLEGMTFAEAARELGCPPGTISSRLTRARQRLRTRLMHRGVAPAILAGLFVAPPASAGVSLIHSTVEAATAFAHSVTTAGVEASRTTFLAIGVLKTMSKTKLKVAAIVLGLAGLASAGFLTQFMEAAPPGKGQPSTSRGDEPRPGPPAVSVILPQKGGLRVSNQACTVESFQQVDMVAVAPGFLKQIDVDIGDKVKKGDVLAVIDAPALALDERTAVVGMQQAKGLVRGGEAQIEAAKAEVESAKGMVLLREAELTAANATLKFREKQLERMKQLAKDNAVDVTIIDEYEQHLLAAKATVDSARAAVANAKADVEVKRVKASQSEVALLTVQANVESAQIALEKARLAVLSTRLLAPFDGVVTKRNSVAGDYISAGNQRPVLTVQRMDLMRVIVQVPDRDASLTTPGIPAEVAFDSLPNIRFAGTVSRVAQAEDPQTRTMRVEIDLPNPELRLRPGMYGTARIHLGKEKPDALRLPRGTVLTLSKNKGKMTAVVYVVKEGKAYMTSVQIGNVDSEKGEVEVLSGLKNDDRVVADPSGLKGNAIAVEIREAKPDK